MAGRLASGKGFTLEDFIEQMSMVRKLGPIGNLLGMLPGVGKNRELLDQVNDKDLDRAEAIVRSMTPEERRNPKIINGSRRARIANGSGVDVGEVSQLVTNFFEGQKQMKAMFSGGIPGMPCPVARLRAATKSARKKNKKKKGSRSGDPRRAAELARGGGQGQGAAQPAQRPRPARRRWPRQPRRPARRPARRVAGEPRRPAGEPPRPASSSPPGPRATSPPPSAAATSAARRSSSRAPPATITAARDHSG